MSGPYQTAKFRLDLILAKIQSTRLFIHQSIMKLLASNTPPPTSKSGLDGSDVEQIRQVLAAARRDVGTFETWSSITKQKYPDLEELCTTACVLNYQISFDEFDNTERCMGEQAILGFWRALFDHFLKLSFIHPQFFIPGGHTLGRSIDIIKESWHEFIAINVQLKFDRPKLTKEYLDRLSNEGGSGGVDTPLGRGGKVVTPTPSRTEPKSTICVAIC